MKNKAKTLKFDIVSALLILASLFLMSVGVTNAWFSQSEPDAVIITIQSQTLQLQVLQNSTVLSDGDSIVLTQKIVPDVNFALNLSLKNNDTGSDSMYVRFKLTMLVLDVPNNTSNEISLTLVGCDFTKNGNYYTYASKLASNQTLQICTNASITLDDFLTFTSGSVIQLYLDIEASIDGTFA